MATPIVVTYPAPQVIGANQSGAASIYVLNSEPFTPNNNYPIMFKVVLTSEDDNSAVNFTLVGTDINGNQIGEVLAGPNVDSVSSVEYYASIIDIIPDDDYTNVQAKTGIGQTFPIVMNSYNISSEFGLQAVVSGTPSYNINYTRDQIFIYSAEDGKYIINDGIIWFTMTDFANVDETISSVFPQSVTAVELSSLSIDDDEFVKLTIVQQGPSK